MMIMLVLIMMIMVMMLPLMIIMMMMLPLMMILMMISCNYGFPTQHIFSIESSNV